MGGGVATRPRGYPPVRGPHPRNRSASSALSLTHLYETITASVGPSTTNTQSASIGRVSATP